MSRTWIVGVVTLSILTPSAPAFGQGGPRHLVGPSAQSVLQMEPADFTGFLDGVRAVWEWADAHTAMYDERIPPVFAAWPEEPVAWENATNCLLGTSAPSATDDEILDELSRRVSDGTVAPGAPALLGILVSCERIYGR